MEYEAVTGDIGLGDPDDKYCSRVTVRLDAMERTSDAVGQLRRRRVGRKGGWTPGQAGAGEPAFVPTRHDTMRLRLTGKGGSQ